MKTHTVLFITSLVISNAHAMEKESSIITDFILTERMITEYQLPKEIAPLIKELCLQIREDQVSYERHPYNNYVGMPAWDDYGIPKAYLYYLTTQQGDCLQKYFEAYVIHNHYKEKERVEMIYSLESKKDYKIFKTIPIAIRRYLTKIPKPSYEGFGYSHTDINEYKVLRVEYGEENDFKPKAKFIIHEEKIKNVTPIIYQIQHYKNYD